MKIMIQNSIFYPDVIGGAEIATHVLAVRLSERGWQVDAMTTTGRRGGADRLTTRPLEGTTGQVYEAGSSGFQDLYEDGAPAPQANLPVRALHHFSTVYSRRWQRLAGEALDRARPDLLHTNTIVGMSPAIWRAAGERNIPVVHTLHDYHLLCPRTTLLRSRGTDCLEPPLPCRALASLKLAQCKGVQVVTAPSHFVLQRHLRAGGFTDARAEVVPNACEYLPESIPERPMAGAQRGLTWANWPHTRACPACWRPWTCCSPTPPARTCSSISPGPGPWPNGWSNSARRTATGPASTAWWPAKPRAGC